MSQRVRLLAVIGGAAVLFLVGILALWWRRRGGSAESDDGTPGTARSTAGSLHRTLTSAGAKRFYVSVAGFALVVGILALMVRLLGIVSTVVYVVAFLFTATLLPVTIGIARAGTPFNVAIGKFHVVLGAFAFGHHYLVQLNDTWEWCPGDEKHFYLDGEWYAIDGGFSNRSVLGWRPFGILRFKDEQTLADARVEDRDVAAADGGEVRQGSYRMDADLPDGDDEQWVLDLRRVVTRGVKRIGDIDLIETAEEIIERGQVDESKMGSYRPAVTFVVSLVIGLIAGYLLL